MSAGSTEGLEALKMTYGVFDGPEITSKTLYELIREYLQNEKSRIKGDRSAAGAAKNTALDKLLAKFDSALIEITAACRQWPTAAQEVLAYANMKRNPKDEETPTSMKNLTGKEIFVRRAATSERITASTLFGVLSDVIRIAAPVAAGAHVGPFLPTAAASGGADGAAAAPDPAAPAGGAGGR